MAKIVLTKAQMNALLIAYSVWHDEALTDQPDLPRPPPYNQDHHPLINTWNSLKRLGLVELGTRVTDKGRSLVREVFYGETEVARWMFEKLADPDSIEYEVSDASLASDPIRAAHLFITRNGREYQITVERA